MPPPPLTGHRAELHAVCDTGGRAAAADQTGRLLPVRRLESGGDHQVSRGDHQVSRGDRCVSGGDRCVSGGDRCVSGGDRCVMARSRAVAGIAA